uniref:Uncharacterized protein n=1 Tax=Steinernema glaseri TaxID=37863 RepID=A0A1I7YF39_9BILA
MSDDIYERHRARTSKEKNHWFTFKTINLRKAGGICLRLQLSVMAVLTCFLIFPLFSLTRGTFIESDTQKKPNVNNTVLPVSDKCEALDVFGEEGFHRRKQGSTYVIDQELAKQQLKATNSSSALSVTYDYVCP